MFFPVPRNSFLQALFGVDFAYLIKFHRQDTALDAVFTSGLLSDLCPVQILRNHGQSLLGGEQPYWPTQSGTLDNSSWPAVLWIPKLNPFGIAAAVSTQIVITSHCCRWMGHLTLIATSIHGILYYVLWGIQNE